MKNLIKELSSLYFNTLKKYKKLLHMYIKRDISKNIILVYPKPKKVSKNYIFTYNLKFFKKRYNELKLKKIENFLEYKKWIANVTERRKKYIRIFSRLKIKTIYILIKKIIKK